MKKAIINQMFLGFLALTAIITFVATLNDEQVVKNKVYNLQDTTSEALRALSGEYNRIITQSINNSEQDAMTAMCQAQSRANELLNASTLGKELVENDMIEYVWKDAGVYDTATDSYDGSIDGFPDSITATITGYTQSTFWYKFFDKDNFSIPSFSRAINLNVNNFEVDVTFRGVIQAGYFNMVGTYQVGDDGCPKDAKLILANKKDWEDKIGEKLDHIEVPKTKIFFIADGYRRFGNFSNNQNSTISLDTPVTFDCSDPSSTAPTAILTTADGQVQRSDDSHANLTSRANVYFQDETLNFDDQYNHMNQVAEKDYGAFIALMETTSNWNSAAWDYYNNLADSDKTDTYGRDLRNSSNRYSDWLTYAEDKGINFNYDPNNEYVFLSEDLASTTRRRSDRLDLLHDNWESDEDFSDMSFSMKRLFKPKPVDLSLIDHDSIINVTCD